MPDFSSAVSGFCQVFIVTRAKSEKNLLVPRWPQSRIMQSSHDALRRIILGTLRSEDGDGRENVAEKVITPSH